MDKDIRALIMDLRNDGGLQEIEGTVTIEDETYEALDVERWVEETYPGCIVLGWQEKMF